VHESGVVVIMVCVEQPADVQTVVCVLPVVWPEIYVAVVRFNASTE
jgi:hypothetical protein